jgi:hypothetical protein
MVQKGNKSFVNAMNDIVKSFMKNRSGTYGKARETLPLEGGGKVSSFAVNKQLAGTLWIL